MFEWLFQWGLRNGSRLLFGVAVLIVLVGVIEAGVAIAPVTGRSRASTYIGALMSGIGQSWPLMLNHLFSAFSSAAAPLFGALLIHRLDLRYQAPATGLALPVAPSRAVRLGARFLLIVALVFYAFALAALAFWLDRFALSNAPVLIMQAVWLNPLWQGSFILCGALVLDRLNAGVRPCSD
jgi:hypothetical protein